jgi:phenylacetate-CoA ligase
LYLLAKFVTRQRDLNLSPDAIVATSMMLLESERRLMQKEFSCPVSNRYGCEEVGLIASECEVHDGLHVCAEHVIVEILRDDDSPAEIGEEGEVVLTDLNNYAMPLIRYRVGDRAIMTDDICSCGRQLPIIRALTGRTADFLLKSDGSRVAGISLVEKTVTAIDGIDQMQIIQLSIDKFLVNVVGAKGAQALEAKLESAMCQIFGDTICVDVRLVTELDQENSGKYRFTKCMVET